MSVKNIILHSCLLCVRLVTFGI